MNKGELVEHIYNSSDDIDTKAAAERAVSAVLDGIRAGLLDDDKVQLINFGSFQVKERAARTGRNPQTGQKIKIPASNAVTFRPGKGLKESVQGKKKKKKRKK